MKYLLFVFLISQAIANTNDCSTPKECFFQAADQLVKAKESYFEMLDNVYSLASTLGDELTTKLKTDSDRISKLSNGILFLYDDVTSFKTNSQNELSPVINDITNIVCVDNWTPCQDAGGGNLIYLDKHHSFCPYNYQYLRGWTLIRCDNNSYKIQYTCCYHT
jgi:hypothetical protein